MPDASFEQRVGQLKTQQGAITAGLNAMNEGRWLAADWGAESLEAIVLALNPTWAANISPRVPLYELPSSAPLPAQWVGSPNHFSGRSGLEVSAIVLHTMAGTIESCDAWFSNPASQVSSHYGVSLRGAIHQYVHLLDGSWANGILEAGNRWTQIIGNQRSPNLQTVTIETEDRGSGDTPVTDEQYNSVLEVCRYAIQTYPSIRYLFGHNIVSPRTRPQCCGDRWWVSGRFSRLARELGIDGRIK